MQSELRHNPDFGVVRILFERPGEEVVTEAGAMIARDSAIQMKTNMQGTVGEAIKRGLVGGESFFQNTFTATAPGQTLWFAPPSEGSVEEIVLTPGMELFLQSGAYLASTPGVMLDTKWQGSRGFFAGKLFLLRAYGEGRIWFSAYGAHHAVDVGQTHYAYLCDNTHVVAFTHGLSYTVKKLAGLKSLFLSGEGLVSEFEGRGRIWLQTRNPASLAAFLHPFRSVGSSH